jgi:hypothetical protein
MMRISSQIVVGAFAAFLLSAAPIALASAQMVGTAGEQACRQKNEVLTRSLKRAADRSSLGRAHRQAAAEEALGALTAELRKLPELQDYVRCLSRFMAK